MSSIASRRRALDYDSAGREIAERWLDGQGAAIRTTSYGYDNANRLTSALLAVSGLNNQAKVTFGYDRLTPGHQRVILVPSGFLFRPQADFLAVQVDVPCLV